MTATLAHRSAALVRVKRIGGEFLWVALGQAAAAAGAIAGIRLLTGVLPPALYGELALGMTVATFAQQVLLAPISIASLRFFAPAREAGELKSYLRATWKLVARASVMLGSLAVLVVVVLAAIAEPSLAALSLAAFLFALLLSYSSIVGGLQNAARQRAVVAWHDGLAPWLRFSMAVAAVLALGPHSSAAMFGYAAATAVVLASQMWFFRRAVVGHVRAARSTEPQVAAWSTQMVAYAWPFATWTFFTWAQVASDRWALQTFASTYDVGLYAVLFQLGYYPITIASASLMQLVTPVLYDRAGRGHDAERLQNAARLNHRLTVSMLLLTVLGTSFASLAHRTLFALVVAPAYRPISGALPWVVLSGGLFATGQIASLRLMIGVATHRLIVPKITTAVIGVVLNFVGAYLFGLRGVVAAGVLFSAVYCVWMLVIATRPNAGLLAEGPLGAAPGR